MGKMSFLVNLDRCVGCRACEIACEDENDLPAGGHRISVKAVDTGTGSRLYVPSFTLERGATGCTLCPQLQSEGRGPACVANCLTNALRFGDSKKIEETAVGRNRFLKEEGVVAVLYASGSDLSVLE